MRGTNRSREGGKEPAICGPGSELRLGGRMQRRAKIIHGVKAVKFDRLSLSGWYSALQAAWFTSSARVLRIIRLNNAGTFITTGQNIDQNQTWCGNMRGIPYTVFSISHTHTPGAVFHARLLDNQEGTHPKRPVFGKLSARCSQCPPFWHRWNYSNCCGDIDQMEYRPSGVMYTVAYGTWFLGLSWVLIAIL